jgi:hypothetical protein
MPIVHCERLNISAFVGEESFTLLMASFASSRRGFDNSLDMTHELDFSKVVQDWRSLAD